ncbi:hypothetical protein HN803_04305, partial [candidate division WWE3 bacterium]|nr:hypothetical protein [candidate division WWE3 bacterium]
REGIFGTNVGGSELESAIGYTVGMDVKVTPKLRIGATYNSALKNTYREVANFSQFGPNGMVYMADEWMRNNTGAGLTTGDVSTIGVQLMDNVAFSTIPNAQDIADTIQKLSGAGSITDALAATNPDHRDDLTMEQPWEIAVGFAYDISNKMVVTFDYRYIAWGTAEGYRDFGWDSQHVYAFGMQHTGKDYVLRAGYSYADSPIPNTTDEFGAVLTDVQGTLVFKQAVSMLNMVGFPAISTTHFSVGGGYAFDEDIDFDLAMMYSPTATATRSGSLNPVELGFEAVDMPYEYQTTMQQLSLSFGINYKF